MSSIGGSVPPFLGKLFFSFGLIPVLCCEVLEWTHWENLSRGENKNDELETFLCKITLNSKELSKRMLC